MKMFGVGMEKTGTHTLTKMFARCYHSAHQPDMDLMLEANLGNVETAEVIKVKQDHPFDVDVSNLNAEFVGALSRSFPEAKFVLTIREPISWLRASLNHRRQHGHDHERWIELDKLRKGNESIPEMFRYWQRHNYCVLKNAPIDRLLVLPTESLDVSIPVLASFLEVEENTIDPAREYVGTYINDPLAGYDLKWLLRLAEELCPIKNGSN